MKKVLVINGPSINMLGIREVDIYGKTTYKDLIKLIKLEAKANNIKVKCVQSNYEGKIIDYIQKACNKIDGIIINPGAYSHTSYAIRDAIASVNIPTIEVHISDVMNREPFRANLVISDVCIKTIIGKGVNGYLEALNELK
ncbi:MAG: type II 3-dehydroquinate dehydratase [Bacilli bacterium]|nr:type II 3-dehydroquinate dehydratase [Bacilli bacterium]